MKKVYKWFKGIKTRQELKALYKELIKRHHPDCGGKESDMKDINNEYDELFKILPEAKANYNNDNSDNSEKTYYKETKERPEDFRNAMSAIIRFDDIEIEICGNWIWVHGNTYAHKDELKNAGYRYSSNKHSWYWHGEDYIRKSHKRYTMDEIRLMHGSEMVKTEKQDKLTA